MDDGLLSRILAEDQKTVIQELEALARLMVVLTFKDWLSERRALAFTDSESVKGAFLKSLSQNQSCSKIFLAVFELEEDLGSQPWIERVPSQSNPADYLSREEVQEFAQVGRMRCDTHTHKVWDELVLGRGVSATNMVRDWDRYPMDEKSNLSVRFVISDEYTFFGITSRLCMSDMFWSFWT